MKKINLFVSCVFNKIKKKFFKSEKTDISHACDNLQNIEEKQYASDEEKKREEYAQNYNVTTRWQTV